MFVKNIDTRIKYILLIIVLLFLIIFLKVFYIQVISYQKLYSMEDDLISRELPIVAERGKILDRNGNVLATNITTSSIMLIPSQIKDKEKTAEILSSIIDVSYDEMLKHVNKNVSIENENINGVYWQIEEVIYNYIKSDLSEKAESMKINDEKLEEVIVLKEMAEKLNEYYISFYDENCSNLNEDSRADKIIKHAYWLDILKGIQNINEEYIDYEFSSEKY